MSDKEHSWEKYANFTLEYSLNNNNKKKLNCKLMAMYFYELSFGFHIFKLVEKMH